MSLIGHKKQWDFLKKNFELEQLSHAYLFCGPKEIGKKFFATEFANFIGCKFPDLMILGEANKKDPKFGDGGEISIAQIRKVQEFLSYKSYNGGIKIVIVDDAEKMNPEAQNCFLKTLEEPKGKTLIVLVSSKPDMLLPTIRSRCQTMKFFKPKNFAYNPEKLKKEQQILNDILPVIDSDFSEKFKYVKSIDFEQQDVSEILEVMQNYFREKMLADVSDKKVMNILKLIEEINNKLTFTNANPKLALEILLMEI